MSGRRVVLGSPLGVRCADVLCSPCGGFLSGPFPHTSRGPQCRFLAPWRAFQVAPPLPHSRAAALALACVAVVAACTGDPDPAPQPTAAPSVPPAPTSVPQPPPTDPRNARRPLRGLARRGYPACGRRAFPRRQLRVPRPIPHAQGGRRYCSWSRPLYAQSMPPRLGPKRQPWPSSARPAWRRAPATPARPLGRPLLRAHRRPRRCQVQSPSPRRCPHPSQALPPRQRRPHPPLTGSRRPQTATWPPWLDGCCSRGRPWRP